MQCVECGDEITKKGKRKYCGAKCARAANLRIIYAITASNRLESDKKKREKGRTCTKCGKEFFTPLGQMLTKRCVECREAPGRPKDRVCIQCGASFQSGKGISKRRHICSNKCRKAWHLEYNRQRMVRIYRENWKPRQCKECQGEIAKGGRSYCQPCQVWIREHAHKWNGQCHLCGLLIPGERRKKFCCVEHVKLHRKAAKEKAGQTG